MAPLGCISGGLNKNILWAIFLLYHFTCSKIIASGSDTCSRWSQNHDIISATGVLFAANRTAVASPSKGVWACFRKLYLRFSWQIYLNKILFSYHENFALTVFMAYKEWKRARSFCRISMAAKLHRVLARKTVHGLWIPLNEHTSLNWKKIKSCSSLLLMDPCFRSDGLVFTYVVQTLT